MSKRADDLTGSYLPRKAAETPGLTIFVRLFQSLFLWITLSKTVVTKRRNKIGVISARDMHRKERRVHLEKAKKDSEV